MSFFRKQRIILAIAALGTFLVVSASSQAQESGYQIIRGTRVYTVINHAAGVATFSNACGTQTLTLAQLQAGAIPNQIIPCPKSLTRDQLMRDSSARVASEAWKEGVEHFNRGEYYSSAGDFQGAEREYRKLNQYSNADLARERMRQSICLDNIKNHKTQSDVLRNLKGEGEKVSSIIPNLFGISDFGICKGYPYATKMIEEALQQLAARSDKREEVRQALISCMAGYNEILERYPETVRPPTAGDEEVAKLLREMGNSFDFVSDRMTEWCSKAGRNDLLQKAQQRKIDYQRKVEQSLEARQAVRQKAIPQFSRGHQPVSCSTITDKNHPSTGNCDRANTALTSAREADKESPSIVQDRYKKAAELFGLANDFTMQVDVLVEAGLPLPTRPVWQRPKLDQRVDVGDASTCEESIRSLIKTINERIAALMKNEPPFVNGPQVQVGSCTSRLVKLYRVGVVSGPADGVGLTTVASKVANHEERSCLELKKGYLEKACKCAKQGLTFSADEAIQDQTLEAYAAVQKLEKRARDRSIRNPIINKIVMEAASVRDCFSIGTIETFRNTQKTLETIVGP